MPWTPKEAHGFTHKANSPKKQRQWRDVANSALSRGESDATAVKEANAVVKRMPHEKFHDKMTEKLFS